jgi:hypothetical protein
MSSPGRELDGSGGWFHSNWVFRSGRSSHVLAPAVLAAVLAACSSGSGGAGTPAPYSGPAIATAASKSGALSVAVRLSQQPPFAGDLDAELSITETSGNTPVDGLTLVIKPWMPQMKHGTSVTPTVMAEGGGKYLVTGLYLFMPGIWELQTALSGAKTDSVDPQFNVQ